jgi:hypothetical protein
MALAAADSRCLEVQLGYTIVVRVNSITVVSMIMVGQTLRAH